MPRKRKRSRAIRRGVLVAAYAALLVTFILIAVIEEKPGTDEVYGSLDGRFDSDIVIEREGNTYHYREMEITNYLIIGVDDQDMTAGGFQNSCQADFLVLMSVDRRNRQITPVMIDRDTIADVTTYGVFGNTSGKRQMQICLAQAFRGKETTGSDNTVDAVTRLLCGAPIDYYIAIDIEGITLLNDAIGGVEVTLEDDFTALDPKMTRGTEVLLKGAQAEIFVRSRMNIADGTNASRMNRQRMYLESLMSKLFAQSNGQNDWLEDGLEALTGHYEANMSDTVIYDALQRYDDYDIKPFVTLPGEYHIGTDNFTEFWLDENGTQDILTDLWFR